MSTGKLSAYMDEIARLYEDGLGPREILLQLKLPVTRMAISSAITRLANDGRLTRRPVGTNSYNHRSKLAAHMDEIARLYLEEELDAVEIHARLGVPVDRRSIDDALKRLSRQNRIELRPRAAPPASVPRPPSSQAPERWTIRPSSPELEEESGIFATSGRPRLTCDWPVEEGGKGRPWIKCGATCTRLPYCPEHAAIARGVPLSPQHALPP